MISEDIEKTNIFVIISSKYVTLYKKASQSNSLILGAITEAAVKFDMEIINPE